MASNRTTAFDPTDAEFRRHRYERYAQLRDSTPVCWYEAGQAWVVLRYDDVEAVLRDDRYGNEDADFVDPGFATLRQNATPALDRFLTTMLLFRDPPDHARLRSLVAKAFTPRTIERLLPRLRLRVEQLLDQAGDEFDLVAAVASPLPALTVCELLGVPGEDRGRLHQWSFVINDMTDLPIPLALAGEAEAAATALHAYLDGIVHERRAAPTDDLASQLIAAEEGGDRLSHEEVIATLALLLIAGHDTTVGLIGNGTHLLLTHPEQLTALRQDRALLKSAIEEMLRYESPLQMAPSSGRFARSMVEVCGTDIPPGQRVVPLLGAANRDGTQFPDPNRFDIARDPNRHVAFGRGLHFCVGAALARAEAALVFDALLDRYDRIAPAGEPVWRDSFSFRQLLSLPVRVG